MTPTEVNRFARLRGAGVVLWLVIPLAAGIGLLASTTRVRPSLRAEFPVEIERVGETAAPSPPRSSEKQSGAAAGAVPAADAPPQLVAESTRFDFGQMDPYTTGTHVFVIKNAGQGPLRLLDHRSTCKCTASEFPREPIAPGAEAEITVRWRTELNNRRFEQSAIVETNDPQTPSLTLTVSGEVLVQIGADPPEISLPGIRPDTAASASTLISSQVWSDFTLANIRCSLDGTTWTVEPASPTECEQLKVRAAQRLTVHLPSTLEVGPFTHSITFDVVPTDSGADVKQYQLPLHGKVLRRLAVYGPGIDHLGNLRLGVVPAGQELRRRLTLKVYDQLPELTLKGSDVKPDFVQVTVTPCPVNEQSKGLYFLDVVVPKTAPACRHQEQQSGTLTLRFDHPRIEELQLRVHLAVAKQLVDHP